MLSDEILDCAAKAQPRSQRRDGLIKPQRLALGYHRTSLGEILPKVLGAKSGENLGAPTAMRQMSIAVARAKGIELDPVRTKRERDAQFRVQCRGRRRVSSIVQVMSRHDAARPNTNPGRRRILLPVGRG